MTGQQQQQQSSRLNDPGVTRLRSFGDSIFGSMSARAMELGAINLGQGFPDSDGPASMLERAQEEIASGNNQYAPVQGLLELREAVARHQGRYGLHVDPATEVLVTVGATEAITATILGLVEPGQEVIVLEPYFDSYVAAIALAGAQRVAVPLREVQCGDGKAWDVDLEALRAAVTEKTAMIVVNSPHNPTGSVLSREGLEGIAVLARDKDLFVLSDEVYEHLVFSGYEHVSCASLPGMWERTITVSSAAKSFNATGWKTGWAVAPENLLRHVLKAKQFLTYVGVTPLQPAVAQALDTELPWVEDMSARLEEKVRKVATALEECGLDAYVSHGTYYVIARIPERFKDDVEFCRFLVEEVGVAAIPVSAFSDHTEQWKRFVRFACCKRDEVLDQAIERLKGAM
ncbi:pyridoxal phosphate-dependent aminotransferase [Corynebacterium sp. 320]|uniref:pyridoxal phosphate-dependent aminotransferase n=1 Tax=Corynebacterium TaxID=1716 RepID=UPI00125CA78E|nr:MULTISPECIES: pyridoxal phosphate-dependent aminotransferase [Corynebacterium]KAB1503591.1 pyridoxal phosphate-dependent aminotransferase [Corynebacterium sp. 320]KAB1553308.1 pyridoxal phosphate-dependent aminotransferase [Corynebacterium sp. 321]KAB1553474.1 pyridoxal phosphate-dependent aminotransferase [Corynebacterium sp. 319]KAB3527727.1 pyridoxal phosphate-dependent aminotransferase [Corynebacterium sp. 250]KAB3540782.1 pyridoxal phosphate-dependent aminotransferase [Corynebacterium 